MLRVPIIIAASLTAGVLTAIPASATMLSSGPLPILGVTSNVQQVAMMGGHRLFFRNRFGNRFAFRNRFVNRRFFFRHRFFDRDRAFFAFNVGPGFVGPYGYGYGYGAPAGYDHIQYCMSRYRTYDPATDTFIGYDGMRHRCGASYGGSYSGSYGSGSYGGSY